MNESANDRVGPMADPPHPGQLIREGMDDLDWSVTETAERLGCQRGTLSRVLNGKAGLSPTMALAFEAIDWGTADFWMRLQAFYDLSHARRAQNRRRPARRPAASVIKPRARVAGRSSR